MAAPFVMAAVNTRVVRRSNALLALRGEAYGETFAYTECMETARKSAAWAAYLGMGAVSGVLQSAVGRKPLRRFGPPPGSGPTEAQMDKGGFRARCLGVAGDGTKALATVTSEGDAGDRSTVRPRCRVAPGRCLPGALTRTGLGDFHHPAPPLARLAPIPDPRSGRRPVDSAEGSSRG